MRSRVLLASLLFARLARAQAANLTERSDSSTRAECRRALATSVASDTTGQHDARSVLAICDLSGPNEFARLWTTTVVTDGDLPDLVRGSRYIHDERIYDTLLVVARRESRPDVIRQAALDVLASYLVPHLAYPPLRRTATGYRLQSTSTNVVPGDVPIPSSASTEILATMQSVAKGASSAALREYAARLHDELRDYLAATADRPDPSLVHLTYVCGNRFRISNGNEQAMPLTYTLVGTTMDKVEIRVSGSAGVDRPSTKDLETRVPADVQLFYRGRRIVERANGHRPCP